ncbi:MAG: CARDB domain-containing protein, partial [Candidatus Thorarchaeota archaeon]
EDVILSFTIHNDGDLDANTVSFEVSDEDTGWTTSRPSTQGLAAESSHDFNVTLPSEPIGSHRLRIELDYNQAVEESDEENNVVYITVPDADEDSLSDVREGIFGTNPSSSDSDGDGLKDSPHMRWGPRDWPAEQDALVDTDGDGLINALDTDSDNDGYLDGVDIDPLHDLLVKLEITKLEIEDPIDYDIVMKSRTVRVPYLSCSWSGCRIRYTSFTIWYPAIVKDKRADPFFRVRILDQWQSENWMHSEVPVEDDVQVYSSIDPPLFVANVPDDEAIVLAQVEAWDLDLIDNDRLDLGGQDYDYDSIGSLDLEEAVLSGYTPTFTASGSRDGSAGSDDDDARIEYTMYMDYELSYQEQMTLAQKFSPQLYFDELEIWRPRDIRDFLARADLEDSSGGLVDSDPTPAELPGYAGMDYNLDLEDAYHLQDSSIYGLKIYAHVFTTYKDFIVVQYWFCYLANFWLNQHEGDWEMIQIVLPSKGTSDVEDLIPWGVAYSWLTKDSGTHPVVYVGLGSHASRFTPPAIGTYVEEDMSQYSFELLRNEGWLTFDGLWGDPHLLPGTSGSPGPVFRRAPVLESPLFAEGFGLYYGYMWTDPIFWAQHATVVPIV